MALRSEHLNLISICTGGGGLDHGVELAIPGALPVCMVEREAFAVATLVSAMQQGLMAQAPIWSDARTFDGRAWRGAVDGVIGGIPCQPHSLAGKRLGQEDERDLWSDARRIVVQSGAWFVVIENVRGILSSGGAERVWRDLQRLGFQVEGGLFTASEVGASHERERFFILAVADTSLWSAERRGGAGNLVLSRGHAERETPEREWRGRAFGDCSEGISGVGLADAYSERLEGVGTDAGAQGRPDARRSSGLCDGTALVDAKGIGRGEGRTEPGIRSGRRSAPSAGKPVVNAEGSVGADVIDRAGAAGQRVITLDRAAGRNGHGRGAEGNLSGQREDAAPSWLRPVFPPGPDDRDGWREVLDRSPELEPAFRRVADGMASRLDTARIDRLRMLGNGVVWLQAAYAVSTLATRLAARGSAGAARLVRMMEAAE